MSHNEKSKSCLRTAFFRAHKSSIALGSGSSDSDASSATSDSHHETPVIFFADKETDTPDNSNDVGQVGGSRVDTAKAKDEEGSQPQDDYSEKDGIIEKESPEEEKIRLEEESHLAEEKIVAEEKAEKERLIDEARLTEEAEKERLAKQAKLEEEVRFAEEQRESQFREWREKTIESVENVIKPLSEIQDGVPAERIKGAAIAATALTLLASKGVIASSAVGLSAAYISISRSVAGDFLRTVGGITWDVTETASKLADQIGIIPAFGEVNKTVVNKYKRRKPVLVASDVDEGELAFIEAEDDDDLARVLEEAESVIGEADAAIAKAETDQKEKVKQSIEEELKKITEKAAIKEQERIAVELKLIAKKEEKARVVEEDRIAGEAKLKAEEEENARIIEEKIIVEETKLKAEEEEKTRIAEEDRIIEEAKLKAEEEEKTRIAEEDIIIEEAKLKAEEEEKTRIAEEDRIIEEAKLKVEEEEKARISEEERIVEEIKLKAEKEEKEKEADDDILFDDDQFMAAVELAQEGIEGKIVGVDDIITDNSAKAEWDAAGVLANELRQDSDTRSEADVDDEEDDFDFGDIDLEALGRAAREAVEAFESEVGKADEAVLDKKKQWVDSMIEDDDEDEDFDFEDDKDLFSADNFDELARTARAAVEATARDAVVASNNRAIDIDSPPSEAIAGELVSKDWSSLKVVELREELKKRGLKTSGRKADIISLLEKSDLEISDQKHETEANTKLDGDDDEIIELEDFDIEELGRQARAAVEMFQTTKGGFDEEPTEEMLAELESEMAINGEFLGEPKPSIDTSKMTVAQLKNECRNRGLKVGGRKAELIERLKNSTD